MLFSFVGQSVDHLVGVSAGFHEIDGGTVDLTTDSNTEIAIGGNFAAVLLFGRNAIGVSFAGEFDFDIVAGDGGQRLAVSERERRHHVFGVDTDVHADTVAIDDGVMSACAQDEQSGDREGKKDFLHFFAFQ